MNFLLQNLVVCSFLLLIAIQPNVAENVWPQCEDDITSNCTSSFPYCPDCSLVDCFPRLDPKACPKNTIYEENVLWGCCPACVQYLSQGDDCVETEMNQFEFRTKFNRNLGCGDNGPEKVRESLSQSGVLIIEKFRCGPDTFCRENRSNIKSKCSLTSRNKVKCRYGNNEYEEWYSTSEDHHCSTNDWKRSCTAIGKFDLVQAKGNDWTITASKKLCWSPDGTKLSGAASVEDDTMNCLCSRKRWELEQKISIELNETPFKSGRTDVTLHCQSNGNYEKLQCDEGLCWCVDPADGRVTTGVLHEDLVKLLSCYKPETFGSTYLRRCESRIIGKEYSRNLMQLHGLKWQTIDDVKCDIDGSFGPVFCNNIDGCKCIDKMRQTIAGYGTQPGEVVTMYCTCAREKSKGDTALDCDNKSGGYKPIQDRFSDLDYCVDRDGFETSYKFGKNCKIPGCREDPTFDNCKSSCPAKPASQTTFWIS